MKWLIEYADGSVFTDEDGAPWEARAHGVMNVLQEHPDVVVAQEESRIGYWTWRDGQWFAHDDLMGFWDYLFHYRGPKACLFGRTLPDEKWHEFRRAEVERLTDIKKRNWTPRERRRLDP